MSEYIEIETESGDDDTQMLLYTNLKLTEQAHEYYDSQAEMEEGSPVAQALSVIEGIATLTIDNSDMILTRTPDAQWHTIIADVSAALKDFFL
ncbi:MAG: NifU N-terminal domain-containing protein [Anaerolineales bacterium]|nr:NifU N-terminal domain-containing protein [Anaerolineales bacterium]